MSCFSFLRGSGRERPSDCQGSLPGTPGSRSHTTDCWPCSRWRGAAPTRQNESQSDAARSKAVDALRDITAGYRKLAQLALPPGAALVFASLRRDMMELESLIGQAQFAKTRPWMLPLPEEQDDWDAVYPDSGFLLRRQVCMASVGDEEWFLGGLFISDVGIVFDTGSTSDDSICFQTGFITWTNIVELERPGPKTEMVLKLAGGAKKFSQLRLQLSIVDDVEWIEEFWKLRTSFCPAGDIAIPDEHESIQLPLKTSRPKLMLSPGAGRGASPPASPQKRQESLQRTPSILLQRRLSGCISRELKTPAVAVAVAAALANDCGSPKPQHRMLSMESSVSEAYAEAPQGRGAVQVPEHEEPLCRDRLPAAALEGVFAALRREDCMLRVMRETRQAHDMAATPWSESRRSPGLWVRKASFTIPLPKDFPKAVTRLVALPDESNITAVFRVQQKGDMVSMTTQTCSHDVPYGENFRVHETVVFKSNPSGGIGIEKWVEIMWVAALPWTHGVLRGVIEKKAKADAAKDLGGLLSVLGDLAK